MQDKDGENSSDKVRAIGPPRQEILWLLSQLSQHLIRIALRHHVLVPDIEKLVRWQAALVALQEQEFSFPNARRTGTTASHAAVMTGLGRREIAELKNYQGPPIDADRGQLHRLIRIVTAWSTEPEYQCDGKPMDLPLTGKPVSLHVLNKRAGGSVPDRTIADWLVRNGNAEWLDDPDEHHFGKRLRWKSAVISSQNFSMNDVKVLGLIGNDFLHSLQEAANPRVSDQPRFRETWFSDIPRENMAAVHAELKSAVHDSMDQYRKILEKYRDADATNPVRVGVGAYTFKGVKCQMGPGSED